MKALLKTYNEKADLYVAEDENYNNEILNSNYEVKLTGMVTDLDDEDGYIEIRQGDEYKYYNFRFEEEKESDIFTSNTLFVSKKDGKYGYVDKKGNPMMENHHEVVIDKNSYFVGAGHNSEIVTDEAGNSWLFYHAVSTKKPEGRVLMLDQVHWSKGWPTVAEGTPSTQSKKPIFKIKEE